MGIVGGVAIVAAAIFFSGWTQGIRSGGYDHAGPAMMGPGGTMGPGRKMGPGQPPPSAFVTVSVATVWTTPQSPRPVDHPALTNPVDIRGWLSDMTPAQQQTLTSDNLSQTQALFGDRVFLVGEQGDWDEVLVPGQPTPKNALGYPGWIPKAQLTTDPGYGALKEHAPFALADRGITTWLYRESGLSDQDLEISTNTRLPVLSRTDTAVRVATPDRGPKWLDARTVEVYEKSTDIPHPTGADLVRYAAVFVNVPYLWGGRAGFGFDCSGFTSTIYQVYGITLPRDADAQAADSQGRRDRQIRAAARRFALLFARQQGPRQSRCDLPRGHVFRERRDDRGIRLDDTGAHHPGSTGHGLLGRAPLPRPTAVIDLTVKTSLHFRC